MRARGLLAAYAGVNEHYLRRMKPVGPFVGPTKCRLSLYRLTERFTAIAMSGMASRHSGTLHVSGSILEDIGDLEQDTEQLLL